MNEIRVALTAAGITPSYYSGNSFRIGTATTAAQCGLQETTIQAGGQAKRIAHTSDYHMNT